VGESTSYEKLEVTTTEDQARLLIKYRGGGGDLRDAAADGRKAKGMMSSNGWLIIAIPKPKHEAKISPPPSSSQQ
jgi:hypothetical protein